MSRPDSEHFYETVYIMRPTVSDDEADAINKKVDGVISRFEGELKVRDDWGNKELAYGISHHTNGRYVVVNYTGKAGVVEEIERHFKILADVMRYITVVVDPEYKYAKIKKQMEFAEEEQKKRNDMRADKKGFDRGDRFGGDRFDRGDRFGGDRFDRPERSDRPPTERPERKGKA